jgi:hypothetical protein
MIMVTNGLSSIAFLLACALRMRAVARWEGTDIFAAEVILSTTG